MFDIYIYIKTNFIVMIYVIIVFCSWKFETFRVHILQLQLIFCLYTRWTSSVWIEQNWNPSTRDSEGQKILKMAQPFRVSRFILAYILWRGASGTKLLKVGGEKDFCE